MPQGRATRCRTRSASRSRMRSTRIEEQWIKAIDDYHFPVVTLSDKTEPDALCTIFETLNRTGVKLSVFELLTARFWPQNINLRALWDEGAAPIIRSSRTSRSTPTTSCKASRSRAARRPRASAATC